MACSQHPKYSIVKNKFCQNQFNDFRMNEVHNSCEQYNNYNPKKLARIDSKLLNHNILCIDLILLSKLIKILFFFKLKI